MAITDNFNHASPIGSGWTSLAGAWNIVSSTVAKPTTQYTATAAMIRSEASFPNDQYSECNAQFISGAGDASIYNGPAVRMDASSNCYVAYIDVGTAHLQVSKRVAGIPTTAIADNVVDTYTTATNYLIRITVIGSTITVTVGGVLKITTVDTSLTSGKPGIHCWTGQTSLIPPFDDFECTDATAANTVICFTCFR